MPQIPLFDQDEEGEDPGFSILDHPSMQQQQSHATTSGTQVLDHNSRFYYVDSDGEHVPATPNGQRRPTFTGSILLPMVVDTESYQIFPDEFRVRMVLDERKRGGETLYITKFEDGHVAELPFDTLINMENGVEAYSLFIPDEFPTQQQGDTSVTKSRSNKRNAIQDDSIFFDPVSGDSSDDEVIPEPKEHGRSRSPRNAQTPAANKRKARRSHSADIVISSGDDSPLPSKRQRHSDRSSRSIPPPSVKNTRGSVRTVSTGPSSPEPESSTARRATRSAGNVKHTMLSMRVKQWDEESEGSSSDLVISDLVPRQTRQKQRPGNRRASKKVVVSGSSDEDDNGRTRRSGRTAHKKNTYREPDVDFDEVVNTKLDLKPTKPKVVKAKERFPIYDDDDEFVQFHCPTCDACQRTGDSQERGPLVFCQGCSFSYHRNCIPTRTVREHLVTKVSEDNHVLQCRRCIGKVRMKDHTAPCLDRCTKCRSQGLGCIPFQPLKKRKPADDSATTPDVDVNPDLINNPDNLLFRCISCKRGYHYAHLPARDPTTERTKNIQRKLKEYSVDWKCIECATMPGKIQALIAWRPVDHASFDSELRIDDFNDDEREYLIKWENLSYFKAQWMPGAWAWGLINGVMRQTFCRKRLPPKLTFEDAVAEEYLRVDIVLDVKYTSYVPMGKRAEVDLARVKEVSMALVKFKGLTYEEVVWDEPPPPDSGERWDDFNRAYDDYIHGQYVHLPAQKTALKRIEKARSQNFAKTWEKEAQPKYIVGGTLMDYQKDGMNWLYYKWWAEENAILADEMGLGKTIQIISFLSLLHQEQKIWPFLIVVPHSTVPNWKREIQLWNPSMRVVAYHGSARSRELARQYEMFHPRTKDLKCHVVVTSYTTPIDDQQLLKSIPWEALIVDEGQRLKNDSSLLYRALSSFKIKHKVLLTGTPLQNNPRELFNLLQFLDPKDVDAVQLEQEYGELTKENVPELHNLIRPYFLRRTKAQVLTMLPPMAEIIVPVTMTKLQKKLYKSILSKDAGLIHSILSRGVHVKGTERAKLGNILMQLRKCLCHPFIYSEEIEEKVDDPALSLKNLIEASAKLELLNVMLPKLKERGHRVLIFSQFLGMLDVVEDFLSGLGLLYARLDGTVSSLEKQKRIDAYNAPNSPLFAFMLSTRAGGVGINLATADTVIILDPDFNPHQDLQALSRAHRIGQKKKVLVFHIMTRDTAEEKIMQLGKKKLSLDHLIIEKMGTAEEDAEIDVESILKFGAGKLFDDDLEDRGIKYDSASVDALLDRSQIEQTTAVAPEGDSSAETAFSFARVWANDVGGLVEDGFGDGGAGEIDESTWDKILMEREEEARREKEAQSRREELGRAGRRARQKVQMYAEDMDQNDSGSDTDFQAPPEQPSESDSEGEKDGGEFRLDVEGLSNDAVKKGRGRPPKHGTVVDLRTQPPQQVGGMGHGYQVPVAPMAFDLTRRPSISLGFIEAPQVQMLPSDPHHQQQQSGFPPNTENGFNYPPPAHHPPQQPSPHPTTTTAQPPTKCFACHNLHPPGRCPFRLAGVEQCPLCNTAHFGKGPICPHINSETQILAMMEALRQSAEDNALVKEAMGYLRGRLGEVRRKKKLAEREKTAAGGMVGIGVIGLNGGTGAYTGAAPVAGLGFREAGGSGSGSGSAGGNRGGAAGGSGPSGGRALAQGMEVMVIDD